MLNEQGLYNSQLNTRDVRVIQISECHKIKNFESEKCEALNQFRTVLEPWTYPWNFLLY
jgi:hypothetical protein